LAASASDGRYAVGPLRRDHRDPVRALLEATGAFRAGEIDVALELFDDGVGREATDYRHLGVFDDAGTLAGYACYGPTPGTDGTFDLYWIAVHPAHHGRGAGSRLLDAVERRLRDARARLLVIETSSRDDYASTRRFYERRGYVEAARIVDFYAPGDDRLTCCKRITTSHAERPGDE
jgi:ribosomal protein S18 acetylase RimI-like enzyme